MKGVGLMKSVTAIYKKQYHIDLRDVDFKKKLKLSTLFSYFQDIASLAADNLGVGIETLEKKFGVAWILTRIRVDILRHPEWDEEITIETWPLEPGKVEFDRDYLVRDKNGEVIIRAVSKWIIMDINDRKLRKSDVIGLHIPEKMTERAIDCKLGKLKGFDSLQNAYNKVIGYSDIDFNGHLNNSKYVDYILDCFPIVDHFNHMIHSIDLHFHQEALPGDTILLLKDTSKIDEGLVYIEGVNKIENKIIFKSQLNVREILST